MCVIAVPEGMRIFYPPPPPAHLLHRPFPGRWYLSSTLNSSTYRACHWRLGVWRCIIRPSTRRQQGRCPWRYLRPATKVLYLMRTDYGAGKPCLSLRFLSLQPSCDFILIFIDFTKNIFHLAIMSRRSVFLTWSIITHATQAARITHTTHTHSSRGRPGFPVHGVRRPESAADGRTQTELEPPWITHQRGQRHALQQQQQQQHALPNSSKHTLTAVPLLAICWASTIDTAALTPPTQRRKCCQ